MAQRVSGGKMKCSECGSTNWVKDWTGKHFCWDCKMYVQLVES